MKKLAFIFNPHAGRERLRPKVGDVIVEFANAGYEVITAPTAKRGDAVELAENFSMRADIDRIVCAGGDGTLDEVVTGVLSAEKKLGESFAGKLDMPIGYIPCGSTNDFGNTLKLPLDFVSAAKLAASGEASPCDVGYINDKVFVYTAAFGAFTEVSYDTPQQFKNVFGHMAYLVNAMGKFSTIKNYRMRVKCNNDEKQVYVDDFLLGMIANSDSVGGIKGLAGKDVQLDDGLFELVMVRKHTNLNELTDTANAFLAGDILSSPSILVKKVKCVDIELLDESGLEELNWSLDGEFGGNMPKVHVEISKQAVNYVNKSTEIVEE